MKYILIAGEPSGDLHASTLMKELRLSDPDADFCFMGGDLMIAQGGRLVQHYRNMAFMGIGPVIANLGKINTNFKLAHYELTTFNPDVVVLIDYPGFNLKVAKMAKKLGIPVVYYISPKIWAWKTHRIKAIKALVDQMYTIFPFETDFYHSFQYDVTYVGNPVSDLISEELSIPIDEESFRLENKLTRKPIIALLAGSRKHEIKMLLPVLEEVIPLFPEYEFVIAGAPGIENEFYKSILKSDVPIVYKRTYRLLRISKAAIVTSGTATLETALLFTPQVVVYKMSPGWIVERFRKYILKTDYFSLVNLVAKKEVVKELFHTQVTVQNISKELNNLLRNKEYRIRMEQEYKDISTKLTSKGAAKNTAVGIVNFLKTRKTNA